MFNAWSWTRNVKETIRKYWFTLSQWENQYNIRYGFPVYKAIEETRMIMIKFDLLIKNRIVNVVSLKTSFSLICLNTHKNVT